MSGTLKSEEESPICTAPYSPQLLRRSKDLPPRPLTKEMRVHTKVRERVIDDLQKREN